MNTNFNCNPLKKVAENFKSLASNTHSYLFDHRFANATSRSSWLTRVCWSSSRSARQRWQRTKSWSRSSKKWSGWRTRCWSWRRPSSPKTTASTTSPTMSWSPSTRSSSPTSPWSTSIWRASTGGPSSSRASSPHSKLPPMLGLWWVVTWQRLREWVMPWRFYFLTNIWSNYITITLNWKFNWINDSTMKKAIILLKDWYTTCDISEISNWIS